MKLTQEQIKQIPELRKKYSSKEIGEMFGVRGSTINYHLYKKVPIKLNPKICKCGDEFMPNNSMQKYCKKCAYAKDIEANYKRTGKKIATSNRKYKSVTLRNGVSVWDNIFGLEMMTREVR